MATASIGGLASGLNTTDIIDQLIRLESAPQTKLKARVTTEETKVSALQKLNTALATLASTAKSLATSSTSDGTWGTLNATSSAPSVRVAAGAAALPTTLNVTVDAVAKAASGSFSGSTLDANSAFTLRDAGGAPVLDGQGAPITFTTDADPSYGELAAQINASSSKTGLQAVVVHGTSGDVLQVRSTKTGAASDFSISNGNQTLAGSGGADGQISVNGVAITGDSNTYVGVVDGIDLTIGTDAAVGSTATVTVARDASSRSSSVQGLVEAVNSLLTMIGTQSAANGTKPSASGPLVGDAAARQTAQSLTETLWPADGGSLGSLGIEIDRTGKLTFSATKFAEAYSADPDKVTAAIVGPGGFAARVDAAATAASDKYDGYVTGAINGRTSTIGRLSKDIDAWDDRLALRRTTLERQYAALETALSALQSQSSWLTSQLSALTSSNNG